MQETRVFNYLTKLAAAFTAATSDVITSNGHGLVNEDRVQFTTTGTLPAGLSLTTNYYVRDVTTNTFKVSLYQGGPAVDITDTGSGTHTFNLKAKNIMCEGFEHMKFSLNTANSANLTIKFVGSDAEDCPNFDAAQSPTNRWDYVDVIDIEDGASIDGDTGIALSGTDDNRSFAVNTDSLRWFSAVITAWTAGTIEMRVKPNKSYN